MWARLKNLVSASLVNQCDSLYFIHIPKTAGTSFINVFDSLEDQDLIFPCQLWREVDELIVEKKSQYKLLRGHFGGGCHRQLLNQKADLLTLLRDPISLSISTFHFINREKDARVHDLVIGNDMSLGDFLCHPETQTKVSDRMTRHLSFDLEADPEAHELFLSDESLRVIEKWKKKGVEIDENQRFDRAVRRLEECKWFGLVEQFDRSMQLFSYIFNRPPLFSSPKLNSHNPNQEISEKDKNKIKELNNWDNKLYSQAEKMFQSKYKRMIENLEELRSSSHQSTFDLLDLHYKKAQKTKNNKLKARIDFDFSKKMIGSGWHRREQTLPENSTFRWTANDNSFIDFWMKPNNYVIELRIINAISEDFLNKTQILINQHNFAVTQDVENGVVRMYKFEIDKKTLVSGWLRITFDTPMVVSHSKAFGSDDDRTVGLAVNWIKITPRDNDE